MSAIILTGLFLVLLLALPTALNRHAVRQVISIFRKHRALCSDSAKTIDELGLRPAGLHIRLISFRDHKPQALQGLIRGGIVQVTAADRLFLDEDKITHLRPFKH
jgi:hypothetical protein